MKPIPEKIKKPYTKFLNEKKIFSNEVPYYLKWLRYYFDFCEKYSHKTSSRASLNLFKSKLKQKNQTEKQIEQAHKAIILFYKLIESHKKNVTGITIPGKISDQKLKYKAEKKQDISRNQSWETELDTLNNEIRLRQYSIKTLRS